MDIFLYGRLLYAPLFAVVAGGEAGVWQEAELHDHAVETALGQASPGTGKIPVLVPKPGSVVQGMLVTRLSPAQAERLSEYEVPLGNRFEAVQVRLLDGSLRAALTWTLGEAVRSSGEPWDLQEWCARSGAMAVEVATELGEHRPPMPPEEFARQAPMIRSRAAARLRAAQGGPATVRRAATGGDSAWRHAEPLSGAFFKLAQMRMDHLRFDGGRSESLPREVLVGADAALVLPYDPLRDRVLLVEQFRAGPARRGDGNPWCLEPVAGIVDPGEAPDEAARREAREEAGIELQALSRMFEGYASPGSSTDHFYFFLGLADLPETDRWTGGLAEEHEDLRLHVLEFDAALALIETGEINAIPLIGMLYWLARHRARLRAEAGVADA